MASAFHRVLLLGCLLLTSAGTGGASAQDANMPASEDGPFERLHPELYSLFETLEDAHRALFAALASREASSPQGDDPDVPGAHVSGDDDGFEARVLAMLLRRLEGEGDDPTMESDRVTGSGNVLGPRVDEIMRRTYRLHREIFDIYWDSEIADKVAAVDEAVDRYRSRPEVAVPDLPKSMDLVHEHAHAGAFRSEYPQLNGVIWAGHWLQLAASDPVMLYTDPEARSQGVDTTIERYYLKLSESEPPNAFPTEMPMVPTIAPALLARHPRAAAVIDNLHMMLDVVAAVLTDPGVADREGAIEEVADQFTDPQYRMATERDWIVMALRHGIFNQGGPAIGTLSRSERNQGGHAHHGEDGHMVLPGMGGGGM